MDKKPKVSVIIPFLNAEMYLKKCLDSICDQTLKDIEIICVDNGSTDESLHILREYELKDQRVKVLKCLYGHQGAARNLGLEAANGEYIGFVDSDDYVSPVMFEKMYHDAITYNADIAVCNYNYFYRDTDMAWINLDKKWFEKKKIFTIDENKKFFRNLTIWNKIFKHSFLKRNKIVFPENIYHEDQPFIISAYILSQKIVAINEPLYYYRKKSDDSLSQHYIENKKDIFVAMEQSANFIHDSDGLWRRFEKDLVEIEISRYLNFVQRLPHKYMKSFFNLIKIEFQKIDLGRVAEISTPTEIREFCFVKKHGYIRWRMFLIIRTLYSYFIAIPVIKHFFKYRHGREHTSII